MRYAYLIYDDEAWHHQPEAEQAATLARYAAYSDALRQAGLLQGGEALTPSATGTTLRLRQGERLVQDGPYADTKEQLGGFYIVEADDMETAVAWAAKCPGAEDGTVEVRPLRGD